MLVRCGCVCDICMVVGSCGPKCLPLLGSVLRCSSFGVWGAQAILPDHRAGISISLTPLSWD